MNTDIVLKHGIQYNCSHFWLTTPWSTRSSTSAMMRTYSGEWGSAPCTIGNPKIARKMLRAPTTKRSQWYAFPFFNLRHTKHACITCADEEEGRGGGRCREYALVVRNTRQACALVLIYHEKERHTETETHRHKTRPDVDSFERRNREDRSFVVVERRH